MIPVPQPPTSSDEDVIEAEASVWGFLIALFIFKLVTVIVIFWYMRTWESGLVLGATLWYWFPPLILSGCRTGCLLLPIAEGAGAARRAATL